MSLIKLMIVIGDNKLNNLQKKLDAKKKKN